MKRNVIFSVGVHSANIMRDVIIVHLGNFTFVGDVCVGYILLLKFVVSQWIVI